MKKIKRLIKKITITFSISLLTLSSISFTAFADSPKFVGIAINPLVDDIRWVYQTIGDTLYKRLYNFTTHEWIGNWIRVG